MAATKPFEAKYNVEFSERGPFVWAGMELPPGEWVPVTADQAEMCALIDYIEVRDRKEPTASKKAKEQDGSKADG